MENKTYKFFAVHGHFYQPPRENPWTGQVPHQLGARPYHDWNSKIARECYIPNCCARINDEKGHILSFRNNYLNLNYNFGPTLFGWLEKAFPEYYEKIIRAGKESRTAHGHSNAIGQCYNHLIMPLAPQEDQLTQALWGIYDFEKRYGFRPEALWLPETAANDDTLRLLAGLGMRYVILSPYQAKKIKKIKDSVWCDVGDGHFDTTVPYLWRDPFGSEKKIAVFYYDGELSKAAAFENLLKDSASFAGRVEKCYANNGKPQLVTLAVDGETFGHHHKFADLALAYAFANEFPRRGIKIVNFSEYLDMFPPEWETAVKEGEDGDGTAWSCSHGLRRWKGGCDCGKEGDGNLEWRAPMRTALDFLRNAAFDVYNKEASKFFRDPLKARNDYGKLLPVKNACDSEFFFKDNSIRELSESDKTRAIDLLEMQKNSMLMFTSCGWFFNDISRIEPRQNLSYAARVIETLNDFGFDTITGRFLNLLSKAESNYPSEGTGKDIFLSIQKENRLAKEKAASLMIAEELLCEESGRKSSGKIIIKGRANKDGTLYIRGTVRTGNSDNKLAFVFMRSGDDFPYTYFSREEYEDKLCESSSLYSPGEIVDAIKKSRVASLVSFNDFSADEKTIYAALLAKAIRHNQAQTLFKMLDDYIYLLDNLPKDSEFKWAPIKKQAEYCAEMTVMIIFENTVRDISFRNLLKLEETSKNVKEAGIDIIPDVSPEDGFLLAREIGMKAINFPSEESLSGLLTLMRTENYLHFPSLKFHLQNYLNDLFDVIMRGAGFGNRLIPVAERIYEESDIVKPGLSRLFDRRAAEAEEAISLESRVN